MDAASYKAPLLYYPRLAMSQRGLPHRRRKPTRAGPTGSSKNEQSNPQTTPAIGLPPPPPVVCVCVCVCVGGWASGRVRACVRGRLRAAGDRKGDLSAFKLDDDVPQNQSTSFLISLTFSQPREVRRTACGHVQHQHPLLPQRLQGGIWGDGDAQHWPVEMGSRVPSHAVGWGAGIRSPEVLCVYLKVVGGGGCIGREGASEAAPEAVRRAVGGGCQSG